MSEQNPPGTPAEGPDPFAELLKGLIEEPTAQQPVAAPAEPATAEPAAAEPPVTSSADVPTVAFTPLETPAVPPSVEQPPVASPPLEDPTVAFAPIAAETTPAPASAFPEPASVFPEPIAAAGTPSSGLAPTVVLPGSIDPTAATTVLAGGAGGGMPPSEPPRGGGFRDWDPRRKALFITLISAAGVLLIALVILLIVLLGNRSSDPTPTPGPTSTTAPTPTPTRTSTPTPTPTPTVRPAVQSFTASSNTAVCTDQNADTRVTVHLAWTVVGDAADIAIAAAPSAIDAFTNPFQTNLPMTATDFQMPFACNNAQLTYSLTVAAKDGQRYSGAVTIVRQYTPPAPIPAPSFSSAPRWSDGTDYALCPNFDDGIEVSKDVAWGAAPDGAAVEVWIATSDSAYPGSGGSFTKVAGGLGASGSYSVPISCGTSGASSYFTLRIIATNISGSVDAYLNGNTAS